MFTLIFLFFFHALATPWQQPTEDILAVLHAESAPSTWLSPDKKSIFMATKIKYPPLQSMAVAMLPLAGMRVDSRTNGFHGSTGYANPRLLHIKSNQEIPITIPKDTSVLTVSWNATGKKFAMVLKYQNRLALWIGDKKGRVKEVQGISINPLLGSAVSWMPDQKRLIVKAVVNNRGEAPQEPVIPVGPMISNADEEKAISTYEARDLLQTAHDEALFEYYAQSELVIVAPRSNKINVIGKADFYSSVSVSPNGQYIRVTRLSPPWSKRIAWWRFAHKTEILTTDGSLVTEFYSAPVADSVPIHGVVTGPRNIGWQSSADATLIWTEALDGGDWNNKVAHRDKLMKLSAPFTGKPEQIYFAKHRLSRVLWAKNNQVMVREYQKMRRWQYVYWVDITSGKVKKLYDMSVKDRYNNPGYPLFSAQKNGYYLIQQDRDNIFLSGVGAGPDGDRPFLDKYSLKTGKTERIFRSAKDKYERFVSFIDVKAGTFLLRRESPTEFPNMYSAIFHKKKRKAAKGEAVLGYSTRQVTTFQDPTPQLSELTSKIVTYTRKDGVPLSFRLYLPLGYKPGTRVPTVVHAYPREYSDAKTAGQITGSEKKFSRFGGTSPLFFLMKGYAVLYQTRMPVIGDPTTAYDTFVEQLVSSAEAAVEKAVQMGVADPERIGVMGHSHGGLMTTTLITHSDLFRAGIARSGAYNHTIRPFGFQNERRTMWEAKETYFKLSPVMFAPQINEPLLIIHGEMDQNPGTRSYQSQFLFEAIRGTGGTARLLMLPFEGHGYRAKESVEHTLWEQVEWFDRYVKNAPARKAAE